jgi:alpha-glucosidase
VHEIVAELRSVVDDFPQRVIIGEIYLPVQQLVTYYGRDLRGANLPFNFQLLQCAWSAGAVAQVMSDYDSALPQGAWPNWVLGNHDNARIASRIGSRQARIAAMLLLTLPGTLTIYYGEELGMQNVPIPPGQVQDPAEKNEPGLGLGRDPERTPMCWNGSPGAGFTRGWPWLPFGDKQEIVNVAAQERDDDSILQLYRNLVHLRRNNPILVGGRLSFVKAEGAVLHYQRSEGDERIRVVLNMGSDPVQANLERGTVLACTHLDREGERVSGRAEIRAAEGLVIALEEES